MDHRNAFSTLVEQKVRTDNGAGAEVEEEGQEALLYAGFSDFLITTEPPGRASTCQTRSLPIATCAFTYCLITLALPLDGEPASLMFTSDEGPEETGHHARDISGNQTF